jgi:hypothetical protein
MTIKRIITIAIAFVVTGISFQARRADAAPIYGRVAISSDGNRHDCDDIAASAVAIALLAKTGNASKLVYAGHSDHIWSSGNGSECKGGSASREQKMQDSTAGTAQRYGGFNMGVFINAKQNPNAAVDKLTAAINASTSTNPLSIIAGGPMEVIGRALAKAASSKRKYVTIISHSTWNETHADKPWSNESPQHRGWTLNEIRNMGSPPAIKDLPDQNSGLTTSFSAFHVWRDSSDSKLRWLWQRIQMQNSNVNYADISDAGMIAWLVDGRRTRDEQASATEIKALLD